MPTESEKKGWCLLPFQFYDHKFLANGDKLVIFSCFRSFMLILGFKRLVLLFFRRGTYVETNRIWWMGDQLVRCEFRSGICPPLKMLIDFWK